MAEPTASDWREHGDMLALIVRARTGYKIIRRHQDREEAPKLSDPNPKETADFLGGYRDRPYERALVAEAIGEVVGDFRWQNSGDPTTFLEALSAHGLTITSLTPEQAKIAYRFFLTAPREAHDGFVDGADMGEAVAELRRLSKADSGTTTKEET